MNKNREKGKEYEEIAEAYLVENNYIILERNWHAGRQGELDLICQENDEVLVFVEVKARGSLKAYEDGLNSINRTKAKCLIHSMEAYLSFLESSKAAYPEKVRFDLIIINIKDQEIDHLEDISLWEIAA